MYELSTASARQLLEVGFMAAGNGNYSDAEAIFAGIASSRPECPEVEIGRAIAALNRNLPVEAVRILDAARGRFPENRMVVAFLGLALKCAGLGSECTAVLTPLLQTDDESAAAMARSLMPSQLGAPNHGN